MTILLLVAVSLYAGGSAKNKEWLTQKVLHLSARLGNVEKAEQTHPHRKPSYSEVKLATTARPPLVGTVPQRLSSGDRRPSHEKAEANSHTSGCTGETTLDLLDQGGQHERECMQISTVSMDPSTQFKNGGTSSWSSCKSAKDEWHSSFQKHLTIFESKSSAALGCTFLRTW